MLVNCVCPIVQNWRSTSGSVTPLWTPFSPQEEEEEEKETEGALGTCLLLAYSFPFVLVLLSLQCHVLEFDVIVVQG